jgi:hypothetical protein
VLKKSGLSEKELIACKKHTKNIYALSGLNCIKQIANHLAKAMIPTKNIYSIFI